MSQTLPFSFAIGATTIRVVAGRLAETAADALVSSDDIYLTMSGGVSKSLRLAGGEALVNDVRKQPLPLQAGQVVVTAAGHLPARYILHAITNDFRVKPIAETLIAHLSQRVFALGDALQVRHLALPLLGAGTVKLLAEEVLYTLLMSAAFYAASHEQAIAMLTIVLLEENTPVAARTIARIQAKLAEAAEAQAQVERFGQWLAAAGEDAELAALLHNRRAAAAARLREIFYFPALDRAAMITESGAASAAERKAAREKLEKIVADLRAEVEARQKALSEARLYLAALRDQIGLSGVEKARVDVATLGAERNAKTLEYEVDQAQQNLETLEAQLRNF